MRVKYLADPGVDFNNAMVADSYVLLCYVILCYIMLCYVISCYVMLCYVMLCYVMLCYVMLCYVIFYTVFLDEGEPTSYVMAMSVWGIFLELINYI